MNMSERFQNYSRSELPPKFKERLDRKQITEIALSPDGTKLAGSGEGRIWVYDLDSSEQVAMLAGHADRIRALAFAPDNTSIASASEDNTLRLWDTNKGNEIATVAGDTSNHATALASSPDGVPLTAWNEETVRLLSSSGTEPSRIRTLRYSDDGDTLVSGGVDGKIRVFEIETGRQNASFAAHDGLVLSLALTPDSKHLASGGSDTTVRFWDMHDYRLLATLTAHADSVYALAFSDNVEMLASGGRDPHIRLWNVQARGLMHTIPIQEGFVWKLAFLQDRDSDTEKLVCINRDGSLLQWE